jgi:hypothetical protein
MEDHIHTEAATRYPRKSCCIKISSLQSFPEPFVIVHYAGSGTGTPAAAVSDAAESYYVRNNPQWAEETSGPAQSKSLQKAPSTSAPHDPRLYGAVHVHHPHERHAALPGQIPGMLNANEQRTRLGTHMPLPGLGHADRAPVSLATAAPGFAQTAGPRLPSPIPNEVLPLTWQNVNTQDRKGIFGCHGAISSLSNMEHLVDNA